MEKLLPQNIEAEQGVLGSIIIDPEAIVQVSGLLHARDFYRDAHRVIYEAIIHLYQSNDPADFITICDELARRKQLEDVGGASYITSLINCVPTSGNVEYYSELVSRTSQLRDAIHTSSQIVADAYEPGAKTDEILAKAQQMFFDIARRRQRGNDFSTIAAIMESRMSRLEYLHQHRGSVLGVRTGFTVLDQMTGGLQKPDLIILAARPGEGKTSLAMNLAQNAAMKYGQSVAVFSLEMGKDQLVDRMLAGEVGSDSQRMRTGWIEEDEWERIIDASDRLSEAKIWIDDTCGISPTEMRSKARRLQAEHGLDLIVVDYLQLMRDSRQHGNRTEEVSEISRSLKELARELDVPIVALSQLSRAVENRSGKVPQLSDLRESGSIEQDADIVMFIYREPPNGEYVQDRNMVTLIMAKHRNGPVGEIALRFDPTQTKFHNIDFTYE